MDGCGLFRKDGGEEDQSGGEVALYVGEQQESMELCLWQMMSQMRADGLGIVGRPMRITL